MSFAILVLWISGHFAFYVQFTPFMAVRHLLLVLPAIMLLSLGLLPRPLGRLHTSFGLIATIVLSTGLGWADWRFADFYREQAVAIRESLPADSRVWFTGYLSWDWYAAQAGMLPLNVQSQRLSPGDYLVEPENGIYGFANTKSSDLRFVHVRRVLQQEGIGDLFCTAKPNHFYITFFPNGPWKISRSCVNAIDIYRVMAPD